MHAVLQKIYEIIKSIHMRSISTALHPPLINAALLASTHRQLMVGLCWCGSHHPFPDLSQVDSTKPDIVCPASQTVNATSCAGALVSYTAPNVTDCDPNTTIPLCTWRSGSLFPLGFPSQTTPVSCNATDTAGNTNECAFTVTVVRWPCCSGGPATWSKAEGLWNSWE